MKLSELAKRTFSEIAQGSPDLEISAAAGLDIAGGGDVTFLANPKYTPQIATTKASATKASATKAIFELCEIENKMADDCAICAKLETRWRLCG